MSQNQVSPVASVGFIDTERSHTPTDLMGFVLAPMYMLDIRSLDRILLVAPFSFTQLRLDSMTLQDKQYSVKVALDAGDITGFNLVPPLIENAASPVAEVEPTGTIWHNTTASTIFITDGTGVWSQL